MSEIIHVREGVLEEPKRHLHFVWWPSLSQCPYCSEKGEPKHVGQSTLDAPFAKKL